MKRYVSYVIITLLLLGGAGAAPLSAQPELPNVVILGVNSVYLRPNTDIRTGNVVVNDASPGPTLVNGYELVGNKTTTHGNVVLKADSIWLKNNADVRNDVYYNELTISANSQIRGDEYTPLDLPVFPELPVFHSGTPGVEDIVVPKNESIVLPQGDYGDITIKEAANIRFMGGIYNVRSITTQGKWGELLFEGPAEIRVAERIKTAKQVYVGSAVKSQKADFASEIVFYVAGINGADGELGQSPKAVDIGVDSEIFANFYVPNGTFKFRSGTIAYGAFIAMDVDVGNGSRIDLNSRFLPPNKLPTPEDDAISMFEGDVFDSAAEGVNLLDNDTDPNPQDVLAVTETPVTPPQHGSITLNADGSFVYTHNGQSSDSDLVVYEVCDDGDPVRCAEAELVITIVNEPPTAGADAFAVNQGGSFDSAAEGVNLLDNDSDPNSQHTLTVTGAPVTPPQHGSITLNADGSFVYTHDGSSRAPDSIVYEVCDNGDPVLCDTAEIVVTVINEAPTASGEAFSMHQGSVFDSTAQGLNLLDNDTDPNFGDVLAVSTTPVTPPQHGALTLNADGSFIYTHAGSSRAPDSFVYEVCDNGDPALCDTAEVLVTIINVAPTAADDAFSMNQGATFNSAAQGLNLLDNDADPNAGDVLTVSATPVTAPQHGALTLNADGSFVYTHNGASRAPDSFVYEACDNGNPALCATAEVAVTIINEAPTAGDDAFSMDQGGVFNSASQGLNLLDNDADPNAGDVLAVTTTPVTPPQHGSITLNADGSFVYTHDGVSRAPDSIVYEVCDNGDPALCDTAEIVVTIINEAPTASGEAFSMDQGGVFDSTAEGLNLLDNDTDPNAGDVLAVSTTPVTPPQHGSITLNADGSFVYTHDGASRAPDSIVYEVCDNGDPALCDTAEIAVTIINEAPTATDDAFEVNMRNTFDSASEGLNLLDNDADPNAGDVLTVTTTPVTPPQYGSITLNADGSFVYVNDEENLAPNPDSIVYEVCDDGDPALCDTAEIVVTVINPNDAPTPADDAFSVDEGGTFDSAAQGLNLLANDTDPDFGDVLTVSEAAVSRPLYGDLTLNADGTFVYTHYGDVVATDSFSYEVCDDGDPVLCGTAAVAVTIIAAPVNLPPTADPQDVTTSGDVNLQITLSATDPEGEALFYSILTLPTNGVLYDDAVEVAEVPYDLTGEAVIYDPATEHDLADGFTFSASDAGGETGAAAVRINPDGSTEIPDSPPPPPPEGSYTVTVEDASVETLSDESVDITMAGEAPCWEWEECLYYDPTTGDCLVVATEPECIDGVGLTFTVEGDCEGTACTSPTLGSLSAITPSSETYPRSAVLTYTPNAGVTGVDVFQFEACGDVLGELVCERATVTVTVDEPAPEPTVVAMDQILETSEDASLIIPLLWSLADPETGDAIPSATSTSLNAQAAGNVLDQNNDGSGDGTTPTSLTMGASISTGSTTRSHMEFVVNTIGAYIQSAVLTLTVDPLGDGTEILDTGFWVGQQTGNGFLSNNDFQTNSVQISGASLPSTMDVGTFSIDLTDEVQSAKTAGYLVLTIQGRVDESTPCDPGPCRGVEMRSSYSPNYSSPCSGLDFGPCVPVLSVLHSTEPDDAAYSIASLPLNGVLNDSNGNEITCTFAQGGRGSTTCETPAALSNLNVTYIPNAGYNGADAFRFIVEKNNSTDEGIVSITVGEEEPCLDDGRGSCP